MRSRRPILGDLFISRDRLDGEKAHHGRAGETGNAPLK
jgi:hypothetical protein